MEEKWVMGNEWRRYRYEGTSLLEIIIQTFAQGHQENVDKGNWLDLRFSQE
jgi:hypothetical protein